MPCRIMKHPPQSGFAEIFRFVMLAFLVQLLLVPHASADTPQFQQNGDRTMTLTLSSSAFAHNDSIPAIYTCDGKDKSPPLAWKGIPQDAKSLVLIVDDPDAPDPKAPKRTWVHWVLYNIPPDADGLREDISVAELPAGSLEGTNDWQRTGYGGPCPPIGRHRYFHKLYALDIVLPDLHKPTKAALEEAMAGHVLAKTELIGTYKRP